VVTKIIPLSREAVLSTMKDKIICSKFLALIILLPMQIVFYGNKNGSTNLEELVRLLGTGTTLLT